MKKKISKLELKGLVKRYMAIGLSQVEAAELLGMSRQALHYWIDLIRKEEKNGRN